MVCGWVEERGGWNKGVSEEGREGVRVREKKE